MAKNGLFTVLNISVVGKPSASGGGGVGKSSLCNRLLMRALDDFFPDKHKSTISQTDFVSPVVNQDHFLYWGSINFQDDEFLLSMQIFEQTEFTEDNTLRPFNAPQNYIKRASQLKFNCPGKMKYINCDQIAIPDDFEKEKCPTKFSIDAFVFVFDVSISKVSEQEAQKKYAERLLPSLVLTKKPIMFVATKCDNINKDMLNFLSQLASKKKNVLIVETSMFKGINIETAFLLLANQITKRFSNVRNFYYSEAIILNEQAINEMVLLFQKTVEAHVINFRSKVAQIIPKLKSDPIFIRLSRECGSQKPRSMISQHLRKLREDVEMIKSEEYVERIMLALKSCLPTVPNENYTVDQCIQDIEKSSDFDTHFLKLSPGLHWVDVPQGEERISFGFLRSQKARELLQQYIERVNYKQQIRKMNDEFESALSIAKYIVPGLSLEKALMQLPMGASWGKLDKSTKKQIYDNYQETLYKSARNEYLSLLMENVSSLVEYRENHDDYMFLTNDLIEDMLKNDPRYHNFDFLPDKRSEIEFNFLATLNLPKGEYKSSQIRNSLQALAPSLESLLVNEDAIFTLDRKENFNIALLGDTVWLNRVREDYNKALLEDKIDIGGLKGWNGISFETFDVTLVESHSAMFKPHACLCFISSSEDIEMMRLLFKSLFIPDILHDADENQDDLKWFSKARRCKLWGIPLVIIASTNHIEEPAEIDNIHKEGQFLADSVQCAFICEGKSDPDLNILSYNSIILTLKCLAASIEQRIGILDKILPTTNSTNSLSVAVLSLPEDNFKTSQVLIPFLQNQMNWFEQSDPEKNPSLLFDSVLNYNTRITVSTSFFSIFNYAEIRCDIRNGFMFIFSVENKAAWEVTRLYTHRYMKLAPVLLIAMLSDLKTNKLTRDAEELLQEARTFAIHYKLHLIGTSQHTWTAGCFAPFLDTIWNNRLSSALNQKKANPQQSSMNTRPALPQLPTLPDVIPSKLRPPFHQSSLAGPSERYMRRLYGSQDNLDDPDLASNLTILPDQDFVESGDETYEIDTEETYDTLEPVTATGSSENVGISNKSHDNKVEDILYTMPSDLTTERVDTIEEVVYDMLESNPKRDSTIFSPPDANSLRPIINIPNISTSESRIESSYNLLSLDEGENLSSDGEGKLATLESCYSLLDSNQIEDGDTSRPKLPLPPSVPIAESDEDGYAKSGKAPMLSNLTDDYSQIEDEQRDIVEEIIYDERPIDNNMVQQAEYEEPRDILLPPPSLENLVVVNEDYFPSYDVTFHSKKSKSSINTSSTTYSQIVLPKNVLKPNQQPVGDYDVLHDAQDVASQMKDRQFITKSESLEVFLKETNKLQHLLSLDDVPDYDEQISRADIEAELNQHLSQFPDTQDSNFDQEIVNETNVSQFMTETDTILEEIIIEEELYASPVRKVSAAPTLTKKVSIPDIEEIDSGVTPPPIPIATIDFAHELDDEPSDPLLPPPPPRTCSILEKSTEIRSKTLESTSAIYSTAEEVLASDTFVSENDDYYSSVDRGDLASDHSSLIEVLPRTLSKREKKGVEKGSKVPQAEKNRQKMERRSTRENLKRSKSQSSPKGNPIAVPEETFKYFSKPLTSVIPSTRNLPIFLEQCVTAIEGMSPNGMDTEGIYRIPANQEDMIKLIRNFEENPSVHLSHHTQSIHTLAGALKCFFQKLPEPLISEESASNLLKITDVKSKLGRAKLRDALSRISPQSYAVLEYLILHLHKVSSLSEENKMTASNLAITFWPSLFRPPVDMAAFQVQSAVFQQMLANMIDFPYLLPVDDTISEDVYDSVRVPSKS